MTNVETVAAGKDPSMPTLEAIFTGVGKCAKKSDATGVGYHDAERWVLGLRQMAQRRFEKRRVHGCLEQGFDEWRRPTLVLRMWLVMLYAIASLLQPVSASYASLKSFIGAGT